ncbi:MAG: DUF362 domain-containing protein [Negativicutes bacterium]|nr:DUF362 domain-containing protein [Negativicutes bacterium]MDR3591871.1 DUF362 domain-containing protein [Negativicutes bacterium]
MDRRKFIKLAACASVGGLLLPGCLSQAPPRPAPPAANPVQSALPPHGQSPQSGSAQSGTGWPDLVIVQGNDAEAMLNRGLDSLGGIGRFVKSGNTVVLKPNFSVPRLPEEAATTSIALVAAMVKTCLKAGAKEVKVIDYPFTNANICLEKTGMKNAVNAVGGNVYALNNRQKYFRTVQVNGQVLDEMDFAKDVLDADVFINMPILKHHNMAKLTMGMKNMMGLVWDRGFFHATNLHRCIAELTAYKQPNLIVMDAIRGITANGPMGPGPIREYNQVIFGTDPVAVDAYGATLFGMKPGEIDYLRLAAAMGVGQINWEGLNVKKI